GLGGDDGKAYAPPGAVLAAEEIVAGVVLVFAKPQAEANIAEQIDQNDGPITRAEVAVHALKRDQLLGERSGGGSSALPFFAARFSAALPSTRGALWQTRIDLRVVSLLAEAVIGGLLERSRRRHGEPFVRLHEDNLASRLHETEEQGALAWMRGHQFLHRRDIFGLEVGGVQTEVDLFSEPRRRLLQQHDLLGKDLRLFVPGGDFANHQDGLARHEQLAILVVVLVHAKQLHRAFQVLQRDDRIGLAVLLRDAVLDRRNQPADARQAARRQLR